LSQPKRWVEHPPAVQLVSWAWERTALMPSRMADRNTWQIDAVWWLHMIWTYLNQCYKMLYDVWLLKWQTIWYPMTFTQLYIYVTLYDCHM
jgi:hypothetical protein